MSTMQKISPHIILINGLFCYDTNYQTESIVLTTELTLINSFDI